MAGPDGLPGKLGAAGSLLLEQPSRGRGVRPVGEARDVLDRDLAGGRAAAQPAQEHHLPAQRLWSVGAAGAVTEITVVPVQRGRSPRVAAAVLAEAAEEERRL